MNGGKEVLATLSSNHMIIPPGAWMHHSQPQRRSAALAATHAAPCMTANAEGRFGIDGRRNSVEDAVTSCLGMNRSEYQTGTMHAQTRASAQQGFGGSHHQIPPHQAHTNDGARARHPCVDLRQAQGGMQAHGGMQAEEGDQARETDRVNGRTQRSHVVDESAAATWLYPCECCCGWKGPLRLQVDGDDNCLLPPVSCCTPVAVLRGKMLSSTAEAIGADRMGDAKR